MMLNDAALSEVIKQFSDTSSLGEQEASEDQSESGWGPSEGSGLMAHGGKCPLSLGAQQVGRLFSVWRGGGDDLCTSG